MISSTTSTGGSSAGNQVKSNKLALKTEDFIRMMITQLQNQDPLEPAKNEQLLAQMSQIGQLESSQSLQESLKGLVLQNNIGAASNLIGKFVKGQNTQGEAIQGLVNSIRVEGEDVTLELDNGKTLSLSRLTSVAQKTASTAVGPVQ